MSPSQLQHPRPASRQDVLKPHLVDHQTSMGMLEVAVTLWRRDSGVYIAPAPNDVLLVIFHDLPPNPGIAAPEGWQVDRDGRFFARVCDGEEPLTTIFTRSEVAGKRPAISWSTYVLEGPAT